MARMTITKAEAAPIGHVAPRTTWRHDCLGQATCEVCALVVELEPLYDVPVPVAEPTVLAFVLPEEPPLSVPHAA